MENENTTRPDRVPMVLIIAQSVVALFLAGEAIFALTQLEKLELPGAPVPLFWAAIACLVVAAIAHSPLVIFRVRYAAKIGIYVWAIVALFMLGLYQLQIQPLWSRSIGGQAEDAKRIEDAAREASRAAIEAQGGTYRTCDMLVSEVIDLSTEDNGPEILELNNVQEIRRGLGSDLFCSGSAITDRGRKEIEFEVETSPQGRPVLSLRFK